MRKLIEFFTRYPIWANSLILLACCIGGVSYLSMNKSFFPERPTKDIYIDVVNLGTSPEEMEESVTLKVEEALKGIPGIDEITSSTSENTAQIHVLMKNNYDIDELLTDVKNAVDQISSFPDNAEKPKVYKKKSIGQCIGLALHGDMDLKELKKIAEQIEDDLLNTGFISQVDIRGLPDQEIAVEVNEETLRQYNITISEIADVIRKNNKDITAGSIKTTQEELLIRARLKQNYASEIQKIVLRTTQSGEYITLGDVAEVKEIFAETPNKSLFNSEPTVSIHVSKLPEEDILKITDYTKEYQEKFNSENDFVKLDITYDMSIPLKERITILQNNGVTGLILVVLVLGIFLNFRISFWVATGIPVSFIAMFAIGKAANITINQISLFGMILVIGILVDDGIVISENIYTHLKKGKSPLRAAIDGTVEVFPAVFTSVLTTITVFSAFFFLEGGIGETILEMGIVVIACLGISLLEAALILPSHLNSHKIVEEHPIREKFNAKIDYFKEHIYGRYIRFSLRWRWVTVVILIGFVMTVFGLMGGGYIKTAFFPFIDSNNMDVEIVLKPGTNEDLTERILLEIAEKVKATNKELTEAREDKTDVIESYEISVGSNSMANGGHAGMVKLRLMDGEKRKLESFKIGNVIAEKIGVIPDADMLTIGGKVHFGKPVSIRFLSKNSAELEAVKNEFKKALSEIPELKDITDNNEVGKREITLTLNEKAFFLGLNHESVLNQIRQAFYGQEAQRLQIGSDEVKIWVRFPREGRNKITQLEDLRIRTAEGNLVPLTEIAQFEIKRGIVKIQHYNGYKEILVEASQKDPNSPLGAINDEINDVIVPNILAKHPEVRTTFGGQAKDHLKFVASAKKVLPIIFLIMFITIALTFRSYSQPVLVLLLIVPGICGAYLGHMIEGINVVIMSHFGSIALAGVVINDAVVFIDKYNQNLQEGMKVQDAAVDAGVSRFRAIILTSITTIAGLYPLIWEKSIQAQFLIPMAVTVAYGVLFGTIFILLFMPSMLLTLNDIKYLKSWFWVGKRPIREKLEPAVQELSDIKEVETSYENQN